MVLRPFLGRQGLEAVREEVQRLEATEKETDLFRFFQTLEGWGLRGLRGLRAVTYSVRRVVK